MSFPWGPLVWLTPALIGGISGFVIGWTQFGNESMTNQTDLIINQTMFNDSLTKSTYDLELFDLQNATALNLTSDLQNPESGDWNQVGIFVAIGVCIGFLFPFLRALFFRILGCNFIQWVKRVRSQNTVTT